MKSNFENEIFQIRLTIAITYAWPLFISYILFYFFLLQMVNGKYDMCAENSMRFFFPCVSRVFWTIWMNCLLVFDRNERRREKKNSPYSLLHTRYTYVHVNSRISMYFPWRRWNWIYIFIEIDINDIEMNNQTLYIVKMKKKKKSNTNKNERKKERKRTNVILCFNTIASKCLNVFKKFAALAHTIIFKIHGNSVNSRIKKTIHKHNFIQSEIAIQSFNNTIERKIFHIQHNQIVDQSHFLIG